jgi:beta-lactam-binding protein with PASTA domain
VVFVLVVLPMLDPARDGAPSTSASPSVDPEGPTVVVPSLIGSSTPDAIEAARQAGLDWTLYCDQDAGRPEGIVDQEPPAGAEVARGSPFSLYSARIADCG